MGRPSEQDVLRHGQRRRRLGQLRHERDEPRLLTPPPGSVGAPVHPDRPGRGNEPRQRPQQRRLPSPVGADQRHPLAGLGGQRDRLDDRAAGERDRDLERLDGRLHSPTQRLRRRTIAKNGAPKKAVTTPIGSSAGDSTVRATTSVRIRKPPPTSSDSGTIAR